MGSVGAARKISPDWSQKTMTSFFQLFQYYLGSGLGTIGDFSSEQLLHDPIMMSCLAPIDHTNPMSTFFFLSERLLHWIQRKLLKREPARGNTVGPNQSHNGSNI